MIPKTDEPYTVVDLFDADRLTCERSAEIDLLFEETDPPAVSDEDRSVVERIGKFFEATIDWRNAGWQRLPRRVL